MATVWPVDLPQLTLRNGFSEQSNPNIITADLSIGVPQTRPRSTFQNKTYSGTIRITYAQKIVFDNFYQYTTLSGTQPFEFPDFYVENATIIVKFDSTVPPSVRSIGGDYFDVSFGLVRMPDGTST